MIDIAVPIHIHGGSRSPSGRVSGFSHGQPAYLRECNDDVATTRTERGSKVAANNPACGKQAALPEMTALRQWSPPRRE